jgi:hypothetical protein
MFRLVQTRVGEQGQGPGHEQRYRPAAPSVAGLHARTSAREMIWTLDMGPLVRTGMTENEIQILDRGQR